MNKNNQANSPLIIEYTDPEEGFRGWLVRHGLTHRLCAGGMRVQTGLTREHLVLLARNMDRKMRIAGLQVDGAKCGIDYHPDAAGRQAAMARFLQAIRPYVECCYSMGPDLNVDMTELGEAAAAAGIPSVKMAVARAQGWELEYFLERLSVLDRGTAGRPLGSIRAGHGLAAAALAVLRYLRLPAPDARIVIQGFGTLAKACAHGLRDAGCTIIAVADRRRCLINEGPQGLDLERLLAEKSTLLPDLPASLARQGKPAEVESLACELFIPAAVENTVTEENAFRLRCRAVVPGANLAVTGPAAAILHRRDIPALPDFLAGCGGSLAMAGLFGPPEHPDPAAVLEYVSVRMAEMVKKVLERSDAAHIPPGEAALRFCDEAVQKKDAPPYARPD